MNASTCTEGSGIGAGSVVSPVSCRTCARSSPCWYLSSQYICDSCATRRAVRRARTRDGSATASAAAATAHARIMALSYCRPMSDSRKTLLVLDRDEEMRETLTSVLRRDFRVL